MNEQISLFDEFDWKTEIQKMLDELVIKLELPKGSLSLLSNVGWLSDEETSYSVNIYEAEYPEIPNAKKDETRNSIVLRIEEKYLKKSKENVLDVVVGKTQYNYLPKPNVIKTTMRKSEPDFVRLRFDVNSKELVDYVKVNTEYRVRNYSSKEAMFGCCSRYLQCSDEKKCVHPNKLFGRACHYRHNLDKGRIFYGKNKNVDDNGNLIK